MCKNVGYITLYTQITNRETHIKSVFDSIHLSLSSFLVFSCFFFLLATFTYIILTNVSQ